MPARTVFLIRSPGPLWDAVEATMAVLTDATILGVTHSAAEARDLIPRLHPELIVCGSSVEGASALPLLAELRDALPDVLLVVFGDGYSAAELAELARLRVRAALRWESLGDGTFPQAHDALRSGTFAVWDSALLEATFAALVEAPQHTAPNAEPISVLLIDPSNYSRAGLRALLSDDARFEVVGHTAHDGVSLAQQLRPKLILVDPDGDGRFDLELIAALAAAAPESRICIRTSFFDPKIILRALEAGALAYFLKGDADSTFLHDALALIGRDGASITGPGVVNRLRIRQQERRLRFAVSEAIETGITEREREVLQLLATGASDNDIADQLGVGRTTVETYVLRLRTRLGAETRAQLMVLAIHQGLLDG